MLIRDEEDTSVVRRIEGREIAVIGDDDSFIGIRVGSNIRILGTLPEFRMPDNPLAVIPGVPET